MTESSGTHYFQLTEALLDLPTDAADHNGVNASAPASDKTLPQNAVSIAQLQAELASTNAALREKERALQAAQQRTQELQEQLSSGSSPATTKAAANPFDMVLTLSSEREAALRERKLYKDRAANAEANVAQLESDLAAANATAKLQADRAAKLVTRCEELQQRVTRLESEKSIHDDSLATLQRLLNERDNRILELEKQQTDRVGAATLVSDDPQRLAGGTSPTVLYALESLDTPGELHKLSRPANTIGRSKSNDISINSASVSRFHARLMQKSDGLWLIDLQSINGSHVNGQRISTQILREGDLVVIGHCRFRFSAVSQYLPAAIPSSDQAAPSP